MFRTFNGHGIYRSNDFPNNFLCQATKKEAYDKEGGDVHGATPLGFMPYPEKWQKVVFENPDKIRELVATRASEIVMRANETAMTSEGVTKIVDVENARIFDELKEAAVKKFNKKTETSKPSRNRPSTTGRRRVLEKKGKPAKKAKPRQRQKAG